MPVPGASQPLGGVYYPTATQAGVPAERLPQTQACIPPLCSVISILFYDFLRDPRKLMPQYKVNWEAIRLTLCVILVAMF
jgi:hypothetical protein